MPTTPQQLDMGTQLCTVDFHGQVLQVVERDGDAYVPIKPICVNLGIDWVGQYQRIKRDEVLNQGMCVIHTPSGGGLQDMVCLPLEYLNGWLFGIDDRRVAPGIRDALILYKREAYKVLHAYFIRGYALNERRLAQDVAALDELAAKVRALRADERNIYQSVRDVFAFGSVDYRKDSPEAHSFFAKLQDKFLYAVTEKTAAQLKLERADHRLPVMGLQSMRGELPERYDADVGKNYLGRQELYALHILCEQFLLFIESKAVRGQRLTMATLSAKFDELLIVQGHVVFVRYDEFLAQKARSHAQREFDLWRERTRRLPTAQRRVA
jgi:hypothetical protein